MRPTNNVSACFIAVVLGFVAGPTPVMTKEDVPDVSDAQWIWDAGEAHPKNCFMMFRKSFPIEGTADSAVLDITASDRYVLYVNGQYIGRGPARSDPRFKSYDTYQIGEKLKQGKNAVAVLVYHYGQNTNPKGPYLGNAFAAGDRAGLWARLQIAGRSREPVEIESVSLNAYQYPSERRGRFECSDPLLTKLWTACVDTAYLQMEDTLAIDAWRERVNWIACDIIYAILAGYGDTAVARRHYRMISRVDLGNGVLPIFFPPDGHIPRVILQGNLIWIAEVESYYREIGDREFLAEHYSACKRQIDWFDRILDQDGMITDMPMWNWFDWSPMDKRGTCFANNAVYLKALESCAAMADVMDDPQSASRWRGKADRVRTNLRTRFWNDERGLFEDAFVKGKFTGSFSEMANGLALWCDIATPAQIPRIVSQYHVQTPKGIARPTPIHFRFILWGLIRAGHLDKAVRLMRERYREMIEASDAPTIWELWTQSPGATRSLVHGGNIPALILSREVLGIKSEGPGFKQCRIEVPDLPSIDWAKCVFPSVRGDIGVEWRREDTGWGVQVDLPHGLKTTIIVPGDLQGRTITLDGRPVSAKELMVVGGKHQLFVK
jgi:hypothetical protein